MKHIHIFAFQRPFQKKIETPFQSNLEHVVKHSTYDSKDGIQVELSHTKLVFAV